MTTAILPMNIKPFNFEAEKWLDKINFKWFLTRLPMFALATPAAYSVYDFQSIYGMPLVFAVIAGVAFELTYIGLIALGDQLSEDDKTSSNIWWILNIVAVLASALFGTLAHAGGKYTDITAEAITGALPLPVMSFCYGLLFHRTQAAQVSKREVVEKQTNVFEAEKLQLQHALEMKRIESEGNAAIEAVEETRFKCEVCTKGYKSQNSLNAHKKVHNSR